MTPPPKDIGRLLFALYSLTSCKPKARLVAKSFDAAIRIAMDAQEYEIAAAMRDLREQLIDVPHGKLETPPADGAYKANCGETRLVSVLTEVVAGWMNDEYKLKYREAITNAVRRMAADFVTLLPDAEGCQGCAGRGAGYCPTCKKSRYGTCGDCGKDLSDEERGQFRCELCSQYPSAIVLPCLSCGASEVDAAGWKNGKGDSGPQCLQCGATAESVAIWNNRDWLIDRLTNAIDEAIRKERCATYGEWQQMVEMVLSGESNETKTRTSTN